jgi:hypothetical protein
MPDIWEVGLDLLAKLPDHFRRPIRKRSRSLGYLRGTIYRHVGKVLWIYAGIEPSSISVSDSNEGLGRKCVETLY